MACRRCDEPPRDSGEPHDCVAASLTAEVGQVDLGWHFSERTAAVARIWLSQEGDQGSPGQEPLPDQPVWHGQTFVMVAF